jgi:hypothetical protein
LDATLVSAKSSYKSLLAFSSDMMVLDTMETGMG